MILSKSRSFALLCAASLLCASRLPADDAFILGAGTHFAFNTGVVPENLSLFKQAGLLSPRDDAKWPAWERRKGVYTEPPMYSEYLERAFSMGLKPLQILNLGNALYEKGRPKSQESIDAYASFCEFIVAKYKGRCQLYQIWNEWDGYVLKEFKTIEDGAACYARLAAAAYPRMKAADPSITVLANSVCSGERFLEETLKDGILRNCDGIAFHSYHYRKTGFQRTPEAYVERIKGIDRLLKSFNGGKAFPLYLTETGWPNYARRGGSTEAETGDYIARTCLLIKTVPSVKGLWWYDFQDDGLDPSHNENNFGILRTDLTPKEPYSVLRSISRIVREGEFVERMKSEDDGLIALRFKMSDGQDAIAAWNPVDGVNMEVTMKSPKASQKPFRAFVAGFEPTERSWLMRDWPADRKAAVDSTRFRFTAKARPFVMTGDFDGVSIERVKRIEFPEIASMKSGFVVVPERIESVYPSSKESQLISISGPTAYRGLVEEAFDAKSLAATFRLSWEKDALLLRVEVTDDVFCQTEKSPSSLWLGDSLQVAFQSLERNFHPQDASEYILALSERGPEVYREFSQIALPESLAKEVSLDVSRDGSKTVYSARFPLKELGISRLQPGTLLGFSLLVNDNDGKGRKGYLHWGDGIGSSKDPAAYNWIRIEE